ncbi:hypothetical protein [Streptomyces asoensis]|uniref:Uncharacterized protein n=1 Tax=Streptomyces asoensis TaxID=249586 RepID=A0ABQ3SAV6_9ACTN|nr:hypothetical protein [Streptomyces asoensis]GGQ88613.1 hypothetical protein GCM10010496_61250 [Streptomyces asoensis]GHI65273.1 hypothetical protein Saso_69230 [Streptomyces asoensis]
MSDRSSEEHRSGSDKGEGDKGGGPSGADGSISDEEWATFLRESAAGIPDSAPKEPSARARMVTERLRQQEARGELPEGWRSVPDLRGTTARARRKRRLWIFLGLPVAVALAAVAMRPSLLPGDPFGTGGHEPAVAASPLPAETAAPSGAPAAVDPETPTLARPFAGSPAAQWADGAAGIVLPKAKSVGKLSGAQVEQALERTRKLLIDANLDPVTLRGGRPETALALLDPHQKDLLDRLTTALKKPDKNHDPLSMFSRFDPAQLRLAGSVVKTRGRMTFAAGERASLVVHADYTFVYPLTRVDKDAPPEVVRTIVRRVLDIEVYDPAKYVATPGKLSVAKYDENIGNSACDVYDGYLHPAFSTNGTTDEPTGAPATGPTTDPYDRSKELDDNREDGCGVVSRT